MQHTTENSDSAIPAASTRAPRSLAQIQSYTVVGVKAIPIVVEVHLANGLPAFNTVGLPETAVRESKDRVRSAIVNSGFEFPVKRITVSLSPADIPKNGSGFDLPIAIGILVASRQLQASNHADYELVGELGLDGHLRKVAGILPIALASEQRPRQLILPISNRDEAGLAVNAKSYAADHLLEVCAFLVGAGSLSECQTPSRAIAGFAYPDLIDVKGQQHAKRALEIAAAGNHSMLLIGPPGTGKSMLANRLPGIMPPLTDSEALQAAAICSVANGDFDVKLWRRRPFRNPHHSASSVALVGGGSSPQPGEISLAHKGILFLDELPEFSRPALEQLREPLEAGVINIARASQSVQYPADFLLVAACNPCRCGFLGDGTDRCRCSAASIESYSAKLSGPMLDRIDMHVRLSRVSVKTLQSAPQGDSSDTVKQRVIASRSLQLSRQSCLNSQLSTVEIEQICGLNKELLNFVESVCERLNMSARAYHRILKLARTIADLEHAAMIGKGHVAEALGYRSLDRPQSLR